MIDADPAAPSVKVRVISRAKNEYLAQLVDRFGSAQAVAKELGIHQQTFTQWLNFKHEIRVFGKGSMVRDSATAQKKARVIAKLEELTGVSIKEIFPGLSAAELAKLATRVEQVQEIHLTRLTSAVETKYLTYTPSKDQLDSDECAELRKRLLGILPQLPYRDREIIKHLYGLGDDGLVFTRSEVGYIFEICDERVRQIEKKAIRKLRAPARAAGLDEF